MAKQFVQLEALRAQWQSTWSAMAPRERQLLSVAAALALLTLVVMVGVRPAVKSLAQTPAQLRELDAQLDQMRREAEEARVLKQRPPVPPVQAEAALKAATERLGDGARLMTQGDRATVNLTGVSGKALASWLDEVRAGARARPVEAALQQSAVGVYNCTITLALSGQGEQ